MRLLIVDHQPSFTGFARLVAQKLGYQVSVLSDPRDIAASLDAYRPSVVILEVIMPEFDGIEVISVLAQKGFNGQLILVSGREPTYIDLAKKAAEGKGLRVAAALTKPIRQPIMETTLRKVRPLD
jgi:DNA-binding response OmpR family regulator